MSIRNSINAVDKINSRGSEKERLDPEIRVRLAEDFRADLEKLSALLDVDFSPWLRGQPVLLAEGLRV